MRKFLALAVVFVLCVSISAMAYEMPAECDPFNNELFTVIGEITDASLDTAYDHGEIVYTVVENYPEKQILRLYEDGARITIPLVGEEFEHGMISFADEGFPAFLSEKAPNKFIKEETGYADNQSFSWYYLMEVNGDVVTSKLVATVMYDSTLEKPYVLNLVSQDESGTDVYTPAEGSPMTSEEYYTYTSDAGFTDGLIYKSSYMYDGVVSGHYDITGEMAFLDMQISYYWYSYNLGYFCEVSNNGDILDWSSGEDVESQRRYATQFTNYVTNEGYFFDNTQIDNFFDSGFAVMETRNDAGEATQYLIKLTKPAIITVYLDGEKIDFDQIPVAEEGRTLVPLRAIFEAIGASVTWDGETNTVTAVKDATEVKLTLDSTTAYKNGEAITLDVPAKAINGRTLVPVRFIADCFDVNTEWVQKDWKVVLTSK